MERTIARVHEVVPRGANEQVQRKQLVVVPGDYARTTPILMASEDWFGAPGGFETHPHRGVQTITMVLGGALHHRDHTGADSVLRPGDVQWMTAGRGVLHSEMPYRDEVAHTIQLWLNLPARLKMIPARYVDQHLADVPVRNEDGVEVRVYAGRSGAARHGHGSDWPLMMLDLRVAAGRELTQEIPAGYRGMVYALDGAARIGASEQRVAAGEVGWFDPGPGEGDDTLAVTAEADFRAILYAGPPIDEPVAFGGPFVMNTEAEIRQAFADYYANRLVG